MKQPDITPDRMATALTMLQLASNERCAMGKRASLENLALEYGKSVALKRKEVRALMAMTIGDLFAALEEEQEDT
jgi:hypothetical protein